MSTDSNTTMPQLPWPKLRAGPLLATQDWYDAGQMREYAQSYAEALQREVEELRKVMADSYRVLQGNETLLLRAIRADSQGGRFSYIQARDTAMLEATGPINETRAALAKISAALTAKAEVPNG